jgi:TPR repeat protein
MDAGKCDKAIPKFYCLAVRGRGFEIAQNALGECLLRTAEGKNRANRYADGLAWIRRAANAGFADAQGTLVQIYLDGKAGADADPVEAALWYRLYQDNALRQSIGARPLADGLEERLAVALDEDQWDEAEQRAEGWRRTSMKPIILEGEEAEACRPKSILDKIHKRRAERDRPND